MSKFEEVIEHVTNLPILEKLRIWNYYMVDVYTLKYSIYFEIDNYIEWFQDGHNCNMANAAKGLEKIDRWRHVTVKETVKPVKNHYLHAAAVILPFEDWIDISKCKRVIDNGEDWEKNGCAQRIRTDYFGIYDYYIKFVLKD